MLPHVHMDEAPDGSSAAASKPPSPTIRRTLSTWTVDEDKPVDFGAGSHVDAYVVSAKQLPFELPVDKYLEEVLVGMRGTSRYFSPADVCGAWRRMKKTLRLEPMFSVCESLTWVAIGVLFGTVSETALEEFRASLSTGWFLLKVDLERTGFSSYQRDSAMETLPAVLVQVVFRLIYDAFPLDQRLLAKHAHTLIEKLTRIVHHEVVGYQPDWDTAFALRSRVFRMQVINTPFMNSVDLQRTRYRLTRIEHLHVAPQGLAFGEKRELDEDQLEHVLEAREQNENLFASSTLRETVDEPPVDRYQRLAGEFEELFIQQMDELFPPSSGESSHSDASSTCSDLPSQSSPATSSLPSRAKSRQDQDRYRHGSPSRGTRRDYNRRASTRQEHSRRSGTRQEQHRRATTRQDQHRRASARLEHQSRASTRQEHERPSRQGRLATPVSNVQTATFSGTSGGWTRSTGGWDPNGSQPPSPSRKLVHQTTLTASALTTLMRERREAEAAEKRRRDEMLETRLVAPLPEVFRQRPVDMSGVSPTVGRQLRLQTAEGSRPSTTKRLARQATPAERSGPNGRSLPELRTSGRLVPGMGLVPGAGEAGSTVLPGRPSMRPRHQRSSYKPPPPPPEEREALVPISMDPGSNVENRVILERLGRQLDGIRQQSFDIYKKDYDLVTGLRKQTLDDDKVKREEGRYVEGMEALVGSRSEPALRLSRPQQFLARKRTS